jgi:hypothetical protein
LVHFRALLSFFWFNFGPFCSYFGVVLGRFGPFWVISELFCTFTGRLGAVLSYLGTVSGCLGVVLGLLWAVLDYFEEDLGHFRSFLVVVSSHLKGCSQPLPAHPPQVIAFTQAKYAVRTNWRTHLY